MRLQTVHYYIQDMAKILSWKGPKFPENNGIRMLLVIFTSTHGVLNTYNVLRNSVQRLKRSCAFKKQHCRTSQKHYTPRNFVALGIIIIRVTGIIISTCITMWAPWRKMGWCSMETINRSSDFTETMMNIWYVIL